MSRYAVQHVQCDGCGQTEEAWRMEPGVVDGHARRGWDLMGAIGLKDLCPACVERESRAERLRP